MKENEFLAAGNLKTRLWGLSTLICSTNNTTQGWVACVTHNFRVRSFVPFADYRAACYVLLLHWHEVAEKSAVWEKMLSSVFLGSPAIYLYTTLELQHKYSITMLRLCMSLIKTIEH